MRRKIILALVAVTFAIFGIVVGFAISRPGVSPDPVACKAAMRTAYRSALASNGTGVKAMRPGACAGVDDATVQRLADEILTEETGG